MNPAMLNAARVAIAASTGTRLPSWASLRMSRVPAAWSMMPTTMNSDALNSACASIIVMPASAASWLPVPTSTMMNPSWLTVPNASSSLRS